MIDIWTVLANALWILGLATLLAVWSMASYAASQAHRSIWVLLEEPGYARGVTGGWVLFCAGLAATESRLWARVLWVGLGIAFIVERVWHERNTSA